MNFSITEPNENYFARWISEGGQWELGYFRVLYGVRLRMSKVGEGSCVLDLCCGDSMILALEMFVWVRMLMRKYPENVTEYKIESEFPIPTACKPFTDPSLKEKLRNAAEQEITNKQNIAAC